jgi:hypothetical protein
MSMLPITSGIVDPAGGWWVAGGSVVGRDGGVEWWTGGIDGSGREIGLEGDVV